MRTLTGARPSASPDDLDLAGRAWVELGPSAVLRSMTSSPGLRFFAKIQQQSAIFGLGITRNLGQTHALCPPLTRSGAGFFRTML